MMCFKDGKVKQPIHVQWYIYSLQGIQLNALAEAVFTDGRRTTDDDKDYEVDKGDDQDKSNDKHDTASRCISGYKKPKWSRITIRTSLDCIFPEANYARYRDLSPVELFELFFDEEIWNLIVDQSIVYANFKGEASCTVTKEELKVFLGILVVPGIVPVPSRRSFWRNSPITRNEAVFNAMRRNKFEKIMQFIHLADNSSLDKADKYAKLCPLISDLT